MLNIMLQRLLNNLYTFLSELLCCLHYRISAKVKSDKLKNFLSMLRRSGYVIQNHKILFVSKVNHVKYSSIKVQSENKFSNEKQNIFNRAIAVSNELIGFNEIDALYKAVSSLQVNILGTADFV